MSQKNDELFERFTKAILRSPSSEYVAVKRDDAIAILIMATKYYNKELTDEKK
jgi:hypothetical protein